MTNKRWWISCIMLLCILMLAGCDDDDVVPAADGEYFVPIAVSTTVPDDEDIDVNWALNPEFGDERLTFDGKMTFGSGAESETADMGYVLDYTGEITPRIPFGEGDSLGKHVPVIPSLPGKVKSFTCIFGEDDLSWSQEETPVDGGTIETWINVAETAKRVCRFDDRGRLIIQFVCERADVSSPWTRKVESDVFDQYSTRHDYTVDEDGRVKTETVFKLKADKAETDTITDADWNLEEYVRYSNDYPTDKMVMQSITTRSHVAGKYLESTFHARFTLDDKGNLIEWLKDYDSLDGTIPADDELSGFLRRNFSEDGRISSLEFKMKGNTTTFDYTFDDNGCLCELKIVSSSDAPLTISIAWEKRADLSEKARDLLSREDLNEGVAILFGYQLYQLCCS